MISGLASGDKGKDRDDDRDGMGDKDDMGDNDDMDDEIGGRVFIN